MGSAPKRDFPKDRFDGRRSAHGFLERNVVVDRPGPAAGAAAARERSAYGRRRRAGRGSKLRRYPPSSGSCRGLRSRRRASQSRVSSPRKSLEHNFGGVAVGAVLILPLAGLDLALDVDLRPALLAVTCRPPCPRFSLKITMLCPLVCAPRASPEVLSRQVLRRGERLTT